MQDELNQINEDLNLVVKAPRPVPLTPLLDNLPTHLKKLKQWVLWNYEWVPDEKGTFRWTKVPKYHSPDFGVKNASSTDPATWMSFERASGVYTSNPGDFDGVGFVISPKNNVAGIDVDHCVTGGVLTDAGKAEVDRFRSYSEVSPSGTGIRIFVFGPLPPEGRKRGPYEIYNHKRFLTLTGHRLGDETEVKERPGEIAAFHRQHIRPDDPKKTAANPASTTPAPRSCPTLTDSEVIKRAKSAKNGEKFGKLYDGYWAGDYPSQSEADSALAFMLAFWTRDPAQIDRLFRRSGLMRPKWDRDDYRDRVIDGALGTVSTTYTDPDQVHRDAQKLRERVRTEVTIEEVGQELGDDHHQDHAPEPSPVVTTEDSRTYRFEPITSATLDGTDYRQSWLIHGVLVDKQPAIVGGPKKSLKTNSLCDLCISLGSGTKFLGEFKSNKRRVCFVSGESGGFTLKETARRICAAKGIRLGDVDCLWDFRLPKLAVQKELDVLASGLNKHGVEVVVIDPLYLCLLSGAVDKSASNLFDMGPLLLDVANACLQAGAMPIMAHHSRKGVMAPNEPLDLEDLAYGGIQEFARQWLLISRRKKYEPGTGKHELWLSAGGSVGHGGLWGVDINEGELDDNFGGRKWDVKVIQCDEIKKREATKKDEKKQSEEGNLENGYLATLDATPAPVARTKLRKEIGWNPDKFNRVTKRLRDKNEIQIVNEKVPTAKGAMRECEVVRRTPK